MSTIKVNRIENTATTDGGIDIDSNGKIGVGTASPSQLLEVRGSSNIMARFRDSTNGIIDLRTTGTTNSDPVQIDAQNRELSFAFNSTEAMRISTSGSLGVGTSSPGQLLHLNSSASTAIQISDGTNNQFISSIKTAGNFANGSTAGDLLIRGQSGFAVSPNNGSSVALRVDSSGRLLVGQSSSPSSGSGQYAKIFVAGYAGGSPGGAIISIARDEAATAMSSGDTLGELIFSENTGGTFASVKGSADAAPGSNDFPGRLTFFTTADGASSPTERLRIDSSGNVRIGQTSGSSSKLSVYSSQLRFQGASTGTGESDGFGIGNNGATDAFIWNYENGFIQIGTNSTERMRIESDGTMLVTSGSANKGIELLANGSRVARFAVLNPGVDHTPYIGSVLGNDFYFMTNNTERMRISSGGNFYINRTSAVAAEKFSVGNAGQVAYFRCTVNANHSNIQMSHSYATGGQTATQISIQNASLTEVGSIKSTASSTSFNTSSDYRLKENVVDIADGITRVKQLSPKRFNFIINADKTVDGFLAHEAQTVVPEAVTGEKDGEEMQGIDQSKLVPLLTAALQEAISKIETLETQHASLLARVTALEAA